jgi:hypothetical protein
VNDVIYFRNCVKLTPISTAIFEGRIDGRAEVLESGYFKVKRLNHGVKEPASS